MEVLRLRFLDPGRMASMQTGHVGGSAVRHVTRGIPSDVPVPMKMTSAVLGLDFKCRSCEFGCAMRVVFHTVLGSGIVREH